MLTRENVEFIISKSRAEQSRAEQSRAEQSIISIYRNIIITAVATLLRVFVIIKMPYFKIKKEVIKCLIV